MEKKMILVGLSTRSLGREFFKVVIESLRKRYVVFNSINYERLRFETPHTRTWFVFSDDPDHMLAGIRADAVFGSGYRWIVSRYAKSDAVVAKADNIGLVDYICKVEREVNYDERKSEFFLNNPYRPYPVNGYVDTDSIREKRVTDTWIGDMWPPTLFMKPLSEQEKKLYRHILNATYGKYGTFSSKPRKLDPALFNNEEIKPLARGKNLDGLRVDFPAIDEWDSYKDGVTSGLWPKTNPYLMSKADVERIFQEGSKQFVDQQLIYALGRGNGKSTMCLKHLEKEFEKKEGENNMNVVYNDLINGKGAYLVTNSGKVPVRIETIETSYGEMTSFKGHMLEPTLNDIIDRRVNALMNKPTKLPGIKTVHFSGPVTAVIWADKTKTIVRCNNENVDYEKGLAMAIAKKALGTNKSGSNYYDIFKKWLPKDEKKPEKKKETKTEEKPKKKKTKKGDKQDG